MKLELARFLELMVAARTNMSVNDSVSGTIVRGAVVLLAPMMSSHSSIRVTADGSNYNEPSNPEVALIEVWRDGVWLHEGPWVAAIEKVLTDLEAECDAAQAARDQAEATRKAAEDKRVDDARLAWAAKVRKSVTPNTPNQGEQS